MENNKYLNGCVVLIKGHTFIAKQIIMHNKLLAIRNHYEPLPYSHAEFLLWNDEEQLLYTTGTREKGVEKSLVTEYYRDIKESDMVVLYPNRFLSKWETDRLWLFHDKLDKTKYQYGVFAAYITYLKFGFWLGRKDASKNYCYKYAALMANEVNRWSGKDTSFVSVYDLWLNVYFHTEKK